MRKPKIIGLALEVGQDTLGLTREFLSLFPVPISYHKGRIQDARWGKGPISVYVDDAAKQTVPSYHVLRTFGPHWIPGATVVVLMDFDFWKKSGNPDHKVQAIFIRRFADHFEPFPLEDGESHDGAAFRYLRPIDFSLISTPRSRVFRTKVGAKLGHWVRRR